MAFVYTNELVDESQLVLAQATDIASMTDFQESMKEVLGQMLGMQID